MYKNKECFWECCRGGVWADKGNIWLIIGLNLYLALNNRLTMFKNYILPVALLAVAGVAQGQKASPQRAVAGLYELPSVLRAYLLRQRHWFILKLRH